MALTSLSSARDASAGLWAQVQQQQAQRAADQAQAKASALQVQAREAQTTAQQAQDNARSIGVRASQADGEARNAVMGLAQAKGMNAVNNTINDLHQQVTSLLQASALTPSSATASAQPVLNAAGQTTGTLISVTA